MTLLFWATDVTQLVRKQTFCCSSSITRTSTGTARELRIYYAYVTGFCLRIAATYLTFRLTDFSFFQQLGPHPGLSLPLPEVELDWWKYWL